MKIIIETDTRLVDSGGPFLFYTPLGQIQNDRKPYENTSPFLMQVQ